MVKKNLNKTNLEKVSGGTTVDETNDVVDMLIGNDCSKSLDVSVRSGCEVAHGEECITAELVGAEVKAAESEPGTYIVAH